MLIALAIFAFTNALTAQDEVNYDFAIKNMKKIQAWVATDDAVSLSNHVDYPLKRFGELGSIKDAKSFQEYYSTIFDEGVKESIANISFEKSQIYSHYTGAFGFDNGGIWLNSDGKIYTINYKSETEKKLNEKVTAELKNKFHPSVNEFESNVAYIQNEKFIIRVDYTGDRNFRYASWSKPKTISKKPDLVLEAVDAQSFSSSGGHVSEFKNGVWTYEVERSYIGGEDTLPGWYLRVYKNNKVVVTYKMEEVE